MSIEDQGPLDAGATSDASEAGAASAVPTANSPSPMVPPNPGQQSRRRVGKVRRPWGAWGLSLITLGIYYLYWWYKVNAEVREYDERIQVQPGIAAFALCVPIAAVVTLVKTGGRIGQAQRFSGLSDRCSGALGFLFAILFATNIVYYQAQLNKIWRLHGDQPAGTFV